ncbi:MAG: MarR family transcriptional regulator [Bacteriovoracaceae bacterium]|jgi:MarR family transcriptional regulator, organic hydroperoxide resistance regulator|nr:MarR family transcriptional regulator [Bacteriovoracaceae bacterium]
MNDHLLKLDNQLCFALYASSRAIIRAYRVHLNKLNLTYPQYLVMLVLWEKDSQRVSEIGELLHLDSGTLTPLLKRLEIMEYITRKRTAADEREVCINLTSKGNNLKTHALEIPHEMICKLGLSEQKIAQMREDLKENILSNL